MPLADLAALPKVVLHDHLDGGLRPQTVIDLAQAAGYHGLPSEDPAELDAWFYQGHSASLERYLEAFDHTVAVMQTATAIERVAFEAVEDLAASGAVYAEIRMAPALATAGGLTVRAVIAAILTGFARAESEYDLPTRFIVDAMRQADDSLEVARAAVEFADRGVVGFDLAGPEAGYPATTHRAACELALDGGLHLTIHAGEGDGVESIKDALDVGAERLGHGARIAEDLEVEGDRVVSFGPVAQSLIDDGVTLELCPTSNIHTGMYRDAAAHPLGLLHRSGFAVTINTDNRLMSRIDPTSELALAVTAHGFSRSDLERVTLQAVDAAFCDETTRRAVRHRVVAAYS